MLLEPFLCKMISLSLVKMIFLLVKRQFENVRANCYTRLS